MENRALGGGRGTEGDRRPHEDGQCCSVAGVLTARRHPTTPDVLRFSNQSGEYLAHSTLKHRFNSALFFVAQVFKEEKYLKDAMECSDVIWQRGLLRKGYGVCHGTAGNGYSFLSLYRLTQDKKYLYRACKVRTAVSQPLLSPPGHARGPRTLLLPLTSLPALPPLPPSLLWHSLGLAALASQRE